MGFLNCHVFVQESLSVIRRVFKVLIWGLEMGFSTFICSPLVNVELLSSWNSCGKILILKSVHWLFI